MTVSLIIASLAALLGGASVLKSIGEVETWSYRIVIEGKSVGFERIEARPTHDGVILRALSEWTRTSQTTSATAVTEIRNGKPVRYTVEVATAGGGQQYLILFEPGRADITLESGGNRTHRSVTLRDGVVLLDKDVWHHYRLLLSEYDMNMKGAQRFFVFVPQSGFRQFVTEVEFKGSTTAAVDGVRRQANKFLITLARGFEVSAIVDQSGVPIQIEIPSLSTKVILE